MEVVAVMRITAAAAAAETEACYQVTMDVEYLVQDLIRFGILNGLEELL